MARLAIITDSACSIPPDAQEQHQITIVPLTFQFGGTSYVDNRSLSWAEFYALLKSEPRLPTTAAAPPGAFLEAYREAYQKGSREILCIVTSSQLTATYNAASDGAALAKEQMPDLRVNVLDSRCAAAALGFVVLTAARAAANGTNLDEVTQKAESLIPRLYMLGVMDTLEYLVKGGRVSQVRAWFSTVLQVKPLFQLLDGQITALGAVRTKPRAVDRLLKLARERLEPRKPLHVAVFHTQAADAAAELAEKVREEFRPVELFITEFSQVMSIHTGPGLVGLAFYNEP